jgi:hypothetical protein
LPEERWHGVYREQIPSTGGRTGTRRIDVNVVNRNVNKILLTLALRLRYCPRLSPGIAQIHSPIRVERSSDIGHLPDH